MALTRDEAISFITDVLGVPRIIYISEGDKLFFLNEIIGAFQREIPFQTITACGIAREDRHLPTWSEIKKDVFNKTGGICYQLHVFLKELLAALGYEIYYVKATIIMPFDHIGLVVKNVTHNGSKHLVEAAGFPTFQAIPLDFEGFSEVYNRSFLRQMFQKTKEGTVLWYHEDRYDPLPLAKYQKTHNGFYKFAEYDINTPYSFEPFRPYLERCFTEDEYSFVLSTPKAVRFVDQKLISVKMGSYLSEDPYKRMKTDEIKDLQEYTDLFSRHFPDIPLTIVTEVAQRYKIF
ncbi:hypothetical protein HOLleu_15127 [Holothuria leucospilota]|uniref:arylamine N-acetyltransferase n=1 Tax=Holothuria leucospilota TaxID=206669 RepID=A0A9Q1HC87_HOLLE|nr:hypothetical protein HOLleu_15127 [Holothuria leucospilota]